jgi:uncharacterized protein (DUF58 family)
MFRNLLLILVIYILLGFGLVSVHGELLGLALPFVIYLLVGLWRAPEKLQLDVERRLSQERVAPDQEVDVTVTITNRGGVLEELLLEDVIPPALTVRDGSHRRLLSLKKGGSYTWTYTVSGPRGAHQFERIKAEASDHFRVRRSRLEVPVRSELFVLPALARLRYVTIRPRRTRVYAGTIPARLGGPGVEFFGLRKYQPGDAMRWINWRASARHRGTIYSNEFQQERVSDVGIVLDGRAKANLFRGGDALFEHSVMATAALADAFLSQGNRVSLLNYGLYLRWTLPGYGKFQRERLMQALANAELGGSAVFEGLDHIPTQLFPSHSQIVVVSPLVADDLDVLVRMRARGYQVMVISPDPVSFELVYLPDTPDVRLAGRVLRMERNLLLKNLQRAGVQVLDWNVSEPFDQVIKRRLGPPPVLLRAVGARI